jgi:hypothetical protein
MGMIACATVDPTRRRIKWVGVRVIARMFSPLRPQAVAFLRSVF